MNICILVTDENVATVREAAVENLPQLRGHTILNIPLSESGEAPITHWFCTFKVSEEMYDKLMALKNLSEMEVSTSKEFLKKKNLKLVKG